MIESSTKLESWRETVAHTARMDMLSKRSASQVYGPAVFMLRVPLCEGLSRTTELDEMPTS